MTTPTAATNSGDERHRGVSQGSRSPLRRGALVALVALICYGLTLSLLSDSWFLLAIPGFLGLVVLVVLAVHRALNTPLKAGPVATPASPVDGRGVVRSHYVVLLKRYAVLVVTAVAAVAVPLVIDIAYLYPMVGIGIATFKVGTYTVLGQLVLVRRCAKVLDVYGFEFRRPVHALFRQSRGRRRLRMGEGARRSPVMSARTPLNYEAWPAGIGDGVWFAGDDPFGGVLLVPGTGDLMCMQPQDWAACREDRAHAGAERIVRSQRAGLDRHPQ
jgi:hypothetical protein